MKCDEILSLTEVKDREISALFAETSDLRVEIAQKVYAVVFAYFIVYTSIQFPLMLILFIQYLCRAQIDALETQLSSLKGDLDKEHERWRTAQHNYERQVKGQL